MFYCFIVLVILEHQQWEWEMLLCLLADILYFILVNVYLKQQQFSFMVFIFFLLIYAFQFGFKDMWELSHFNALLKFAWEDSRKDLETMFSTKFYLVLGLVTM